jgi:hypothetical protein
MALGELTKQIAQQALLSATEKTPEKPPAPPPPDNPAAVVLGQIAAMQKALKEDEELVVTLQLGGERMRVMEIFTPSRGIAVLSGHDGDRNLTRVISAVEALQLVCKVMKAPAGVKPSRIGLVAPK